MPENILGKEVVFSNRKNNEDVNIDGTIFLISVVTR